MNCKQCQEKILEALAAGAGHFPREVPQHWQTCRVCREFYELQSNLFRSIDSALQSVANQTAPPSLISGVRARMEDQPVASPAWIPGWSFALVSAFAIVVIGAGFFRLRPQIRPNLSGIGPVVSQSVGLSVPAVQPPPKSETTRPNRTSKGASSAGPSPTAAEPALEVIVLAEERQAFAKFVAKLPEEKEVALALTQPAPAAPDAPVEIALLEIGSVEVKPLEATARE